MRCGTVRCGAPLSPPRVRCDVDRLLDQETLNSLGERPTCEWASDSLAVLVSYDAVYDDYLTAATGWNVTLPGG